MTDGPDAGPPAEPGSTWEVDTVATRIRAHMSSFSKSERQIARILLASYPRVGFETVAVLAQMAEVSGATVVRFTTKMGYSGFPEMQRALLDELDQRGASPSALYARASAQPSPRQSLSLAALADAYVEDLRATFAALVEYDFEFAVTTLADPKLRIWIMGGRYSNFLAEYFAASIQQLRGQVQMLPQMASVRAATVAHFDAKDVLVAFDFRRYEETTRRIVASAREQGTTVIMVTDRWGSPSTVDAKAVLTTIASERAPFDSVVPVMAIIESVFEALVARIGEAGQDRMERVEETGQRLGLF